MDHFNNAVALSAHLARVRLRVYINELVSVAYRNVVNKYSDALRNLDLRIASMGINK